MSDNDTPPQAIPVTSQPEPQAEEKPRRRPRARKAQDEGKDDANDIFAEQAAARQAEGQAREQAEVAQHVNGERPRARLADPFTIVTVALTEKKDGATARLLRSRSHGDLWLQFDEKPGQDITSQIKGEGWRWEPRAQHENHKGAWVTPLEEGAEWRTEADAKRLFKDVVNQIREKNGLKPTTVMGVADR